MANGLDPITANGWHVADNPSIFEPARTNTYELLLNFPTELLKAGVDEADASAEDYINGLAAQETIRLSINKFDAPHFSQGEVVINRGNVKTYFAGGIEFQAGTLEANDYIGKSSKSVLEAWQRLSGDAKTGAVGRAADYKIDAEVQEYSPDFKEVIRTYVLKGCWVTGISESAYDVNQPDKKVVTATIRYDRAYVSYEK